MPSFISNSDSRFLLRCFLWLTAAFGILNAIAFAIAPGLEGTPLFVYRDHRYNEIVMERYMLSDRVYRVVLAGSSNLWVSPADVDLPRDYFRLNFLGLGARTGLSAILTKEAVPEIVIVEVNLMNRDATTELMDPYSSPMKRRMYSLLPILRRELHPGYFMSREQDRFLTTGFERVERTPARMATQDRLVSGYLNGGLAEHLDDLENAQAAVGLVRKLRQRGSKILMVEMPFHERLKQRPSYRRYLAYLRSQLADLPWIEFAEAEYFTNDGVHPFPGEGRALFSCMQDIMSIIAANSETSLFSCPGATFTAPALGGAPRT